jgi:hypothetical protein
LRLLIDGEGGCCPWLGIFLNNRASSHGGSGWERPSEVRQAVRFLRQTRASNIMEADQHGKMNSH